MGNASEDTLFADAIKRAAKRFGCKIVAEKTGNIHLDARRTAQSDVAVFTHVDDYDVLVVADEQGQFGEYLRLPDLEASAGDWHARSDCNSVAQNS